MLPKLITKTHIEKELSLQEKSLEELVKELFVHELKEMQLAEFNETKRTRLENVIGFKGKIVKGLRSMLEE